jgi:hypothetical protein
MSLSSLIVQREIATIREVEEALARQVLYGGDLVTNLLEVARLAEESVTPLLAESYGFEVGPIGELPRGSEEARDLVPAEMAARRSMYPLSLSEGKLVVVVPNPLDRDAEKELSFALQLPVEQRIAPMVRVRQAIAREYGVPLERRLQRLLQRMAGKEVRMSSMPPILRDAPPMPDVPKPPPASRTGFSDEPPAALKPRASASPTLDPPVSEEAPRTLIQKHSQPPRQLRRRRGPLPFDVALKELDDTTERDAVLDLCFDFGRQFFDFTAFFVVHHDVAEGRDSFGDGAPRERVAGISVPLDQPSVLQKARDHGDATVVAPATDGLDGVLWKDLQLTKRSPVLVVPVIVRHRIVALLLGDSGSGEIDDAVRQDVVAFMRAVGPAFERIIVAKKRATGAPPVHDTTRMSAPPPIDTEKTPAVRSGHAAPPPTQASPTISSREPSAPPRTPSTRPPPPPTAPAIPTATAPATEPATPAAPPTPAPTPARSAPPADARDHTPVVLTRSDAPPPPTVVAVRRPRGAPIPREDPGDLRPVATAARRDSEPPPARGVGRDPRTEPEETPLSEPPTRRHGRGALASDAAEARRRSSDSPERAPTLEESEIDDDEARALIAEIDEGWRGPPSSRRISSSDHAVSVPAHKPPSKRSDPPPQLPSVIVDVEGELSMLVDRFVRDPGDEQAEAELLRLGQAAMPAIMARFPGPIAITPDRFSDPLPRVSDCGPVLRLIARQRRVALPHVLSFVDSNDPDRRMWATFLLSELAYPDAVEAIVTRVFDTTQRVRRVARAAARAVAEVAVAALVERLGKVALQSEAAPADRVAAIETLGELREPLSVPVLVGALGDQSADVSMSARAALMVSTRQDFGVDTRKWNQWWTANAARHRIEWLIDALDHEISGLRKAAGIELRALTKESFGYADDLPKRDRQQAQQRYREWWTTEGRARFRRM